MELFERTHKHKDETWVDKRSEQFNVKFKNAKEELSQKAAEDGSGHEELVKKLQEENNCLKTRLEKTKKNVEINNHLVQEMMKRMDFHIPIPQVGETNAREDDDSGDSSEE
ncbi:hypothetical protein PIB30_068027 [Stylosanthes scabra]|uniref:Uncharacterized protein n=1 Tax=Stylosanthes scabra TaxID=79078 RepID=A0ABU6QNM1_9FABA|nr:hypothetical protein [Stylosanthes scabra]